MSSESPAAILYDLNGNALAVQNATAIPTNTPALLVAGSDGTNSRYIAVDGSGRIIVGGSGTAGTAATAVLTIQGIASMTPVQISQATASNLNATVVGSGSAGTPATGVVTVQGIASGTSIPVTLSQADTTATGSLAAANNNVVIAVSGDANASMQLVAGTLVGTIVPEVSIDGGTTWVSTFFIDPTTGNISSSIVFGSSNTATTRTFMSVGGASNMRVRVSAYTSGSATANLRASTMQNTILLSSGSAGGALPPAIQQIGGSVTTSSPGYSNGTINALSLNAAGGLRVDGSAVTQPVSGTVTANMGTTNGLSLDTSVNGILVSQGSTTSGEKGPLIQGAVTTSSPSYTNAQTSPLSLTTTGALRVDGSAVTQPVSGTVTAQQSTAANLLATVTQGTAAALASAWPVELTDGTNILGTSSHSLFVTTNKMTTSSLTSVAGSATSVTLLASNASRVYATMYNDSTSIIYIACSSSAASASAYTIKLMPNSYWEVPTDWTGQINGIWVSATGNMRITEFSP